MASKLLQFSEYDLSNAAMVPHILQQLVSKLNDHSDWIRGRSELVNVQTRLKKSEESLAALEHEIDMLRTWTAKLCFKEDHDKLVRSVQEQEAELQEKISGVELRLDEISDLRDSIQEQQKDLEAVSSRLDRANEDLQGHSKVLQVHGSTLDEHYSMHEEHVHVIAELKDENSARIRDIEDIKKLIINESNRVDERANEIEKKIERTADDLNQARMTTEKLDKESRARLDITRRELSSELATAEARSSTNILSVKMEMEHGDKKLEAALNKSNKSLTDQIHRSSHEHNEKLLRAARDTEARFHQVGERLDAEAARALERTEQTAAHARDELAELRSLSQLRFKQLDSELRSNVEVLKATIRSAIGPELKDMVQREAFDLTQRMLSDHYQSIRVLLDSKVDFAVAGEILKKKADAMELGAFTRKAEVDAMISAALSAYGAGRPAATPRSPGADPGLGLDRGRLDQLEEENIRLSQCVNDLYQMIKSDRKARAAGESRPGPLASHAVSRLDKVLLAKSFRDIREPARCQPSTPRATTALPLGTRHPVSGPVTPGHLGPPYPPQASQRTADGDDGGPQSVRSASSAVAQSSPRAYVRYRARPSPTTAAIPQPAEVEGPPPERRRNSGELECGADIVRQYRASGGSAAVPAPTLPAIPDGGSGDARGTIASQPFEGAGAGAAAAAAASTASVTEGTEGDLGAAVVAEGGPLTPARLLFLPQASSGLRRSQATASPRLWFK